MSVETALAAITLGIVQGLQKAIDASEDLSAEVTGESPDKLSNIGKNVVSVFLYEAQMNPFLRNDDLAPQVIKDEGKGTAKIVQRTVTPLILQYALSFYGDQSTLVPQRLLGICVAALRASPVLDAKALSAISRYEYPSVSPLPVEDWEDVRLEIKSSTLEDTYRLWSALRAPYVLSTMVEARTALLQLAPETGNAYLIKEIDIHETYPKSKGVFTPGRDGPNDPK